ncbi:hypothetical protein [Photobacterium sp. R1]
MKVICLFIIALLAGCQMTPTAEQIAERNNRVKQYLEMLETLNQYRGRLESKHAVPTKLNLWAALVKNRIDNHFIHIESFKNSHFKMRVILDDNGFVKSTEFISSSGRNEMFDVASDELKKLAPFPVSGLSEEDKKIAQNFVVIFEYE